jgi:hypothetical protein
MKRFFKWLAGGFAVLLLTGLAVVCGRVFLSDLVRQVVPERFHSSTVIVTVGPAASSQPEGELTAEERSIQQRLEDMLAFGEATHRLVYDGSKTMTGRLVEEHPDYIVFAQRFGDSGTMSVPLQRSRIVRIETCVEEHPLISRRDIRFYMEFPDKQFYKRPPYTLITEESFFAVEHIVKQLQGLYGQITEQFSPLIASSGRRDDIQLLIFSSTGEYEAYRNRYAPGLKGSSGFYSHGMDRMVVYHQRDSDWVKDGRKQIAAIEKKYEGKLRSDLARESFNQWKINARGELLGEANQITQAVIRHEGAHQLLFTLGVQNPFQTGRDWVTEGLATYCETTKPGRLNLSRVEELKTARAGRRLIPLRTLMTASCNGNSLAYAEAWALTHMLMQPEYRSGFFAYLDWLRKHPSSFGANSVKELCSFIALCPDELETERTTYIDGLIKRQK